MQYYLNMKYQTYKFVLNNVSEPSVLCNYRDALIISWGNAYYCLKEHKNLVSHKNPAAALPKTYIYAPRNRSSPGVLQSLPPCVSGEKTSDAISLKVNYQHLLLHISNIRHNRKSRKLFWKSSMIYTTQRAALYVVLIFT